MRPGLGRRSTSKETLQILAEACRLSTDLAGIDADPHEALSDPSCRGRRRALRNWISRSNARCSACADRFQENWRARKSPARARRRRPSSSSNRSMALAKTGARSRQSRYPHPAPDSKRSWNRRRSSVSQARGPPGRAARTLRRTRQDQETCAFEQRLSPIGPQYPRWSTSPASGGWQSRRATRGPPGWPVRRGRAAGACAAGERPIRVEQETDVLAQFQRAQKQNVAGVRRGTSHGRATSACPEGRPSCARRYAELFFDCVAV